MQIAIIEDDQRDCEALSQYLHQLAKEREIQFDLSSFSSAEQFLQMEHQRFDVVFMDICMPGMNGLDAAHQMRLYNQKTILILVTNMAQMAIRGYEVDALDFMIKPVTYEDLFMKMRHALRYKAQLTSKSLVISNKGRTQPVRIDQIQYVEVQGHILIFKTTMGILQERGSISKYSKALKDSHFLRCNNCYLVNLKYVKKIEKNSVDVGGDVLQISRSRKKDFMTGLLEFWGDGVN